MEKLHFLNPQIDIFNRLFTWQYFTFFIKIKLYYVFLIEF